MNLIKPTKFFKVTITSRIRWLIQELAVSNMLEIEALRQLLFEKGIITQDEFIAKYKKLDREMKEKGKNSLFCL